MNDERQERLYRVVFRRDGSKKDYEIFVSASIWARAARKACDILKEAKADAANWRLVMLKETGE